MDYLSAGRETLKKVLLDYERIDNLQTTPGVYSSVLFDADRDHYMMVSRGWDGKRRVKVTFIYVRIYDGKFWIEEDWSEEGIATHLLNAGVPNDKIILAFQHPSMREFTEFAVA